jgi:hypothetical protein
MCEFDQPYRGFAFRQSDHALLCIHGRPSVKLNSYVETLTTWPSSVYLAPVQRLKPIDEKRDLLLF